VVSGKFAHICYLVDSGDKRSAPITSVLAVKSNQARMRDASFRAIRLCSSSGVVEAGCETAVGVRCKRAGMHWTVAGANAIIALRCCKLSDRFEDFWERRAAA
jgi:hypothetical protein